jgi:hypothetical protein
MSYFIVGIWRIVLLEALAAIFFVRRAARERWRRTLTVLMVLIAGITVYMWTNFGELRGGGNMIHRWEQTHFYFGSKYLPEINYFDLYKALMIADREMGGQTRGVEKTRDLHTFDDLPVSVALLDAPRVRAEFSDKRWAEFKNDVMVLSRWPTPWGGILQDHGNTGSPAWALVAAPIATLVGINERGQKIMASLDILLMLGLFVFIQRTFGWRVMAASLTVWAMMPFCFDFLAGSFLRWDWLFATGMAMCFWKRKRPVVAGAFMGYAIASKLFPVFFAVGLLAKAAYDAVRARRIEPKVTRFAGGLVGAMVLLFAVSSATFGGPHIWRDYKERIDVARFEKFYGNQYSFRTVFLQAANTPFKQFVHDWAQPGEIKQARKDVEITNYPVSFRVAQLLLTLLILGAAARSRDDIQAMAAGPLLVYVWLIVNAYYWNMMGLFALAVAARELERRARLLPTVVMLHGMIAAFYLYLHYNRGFAEGYFVGCLMFFLIVVWSTNELVGSLRLRPLAVSGALGRRLDSLQRVDEVH